MEKKKYDCVGYFYNGFACVELSDKWGFINKNGEEITPIKYDWVYDFINGFACVELSNKWGFINENGKEVIPCEYTYDEIKPLIENLRKNGEVSIDSVNSSVIDERCKSVLKYLIPDYETEMNVKRYNNAMDALRSIYYGTPTNKD